MGESGKELQEEYSGRLSLSFLEAVAEADRQEGDRGLVMRGLGEVTVPMSVATARAQPILDGGDGASDSVQKVLACRAQRQKDFREQLGAETWRFRDICPKSAISQLARTGEYPADDALTLLGARPATPQEREEHLRAVIDLLKQHENYELGLLDDEAIHVCQTFWLVKQGRSVVLETWPRDADGKRVELDISIAEPIVVDGFYEYFSRLWDALGSSNRRRQYVISFLEQQIREIPRL